jgi:anaerobic selenocysteine-containing dehydrogenase
MELESEPTLWVHPADAKSRGIRDGDHAEMFNDRGSGTVRVEVTTEVMQGHVSLNDCWPELNVVTSSACPVDPKVTAALKVGGQPSYQNVLVDISRVKRSRRSSAPA